MRTFRPLAAGVAVLAAVPLVASAQSRAPVPPPLPPQATFLPTSAPATAVPTPIASAPAAVAAAAQREFVAWQNGTVDANAYEPAFQTGLDPDRIAAVRTLLAPLGPPQSLASLGSLVQSGMTLYLFRVLGAGGATLESVAMRPNGTVGAVFFSNVASPPTPAP